MVDDGYLIGYEDGSGNFVEVGRFNNAAEDTSQPILIEHTASGERVELDGTGVNLNGSDVRNVGALDADSISTEKAQNETDILLIGPSGALIHRIDPSGSTTPIQDAITTVADAGGGNVLLPARAVQDTGPLPDRDDVTVTGRGYKTSVVEITGDGNHGLKASNGSNGMVFQDFQLTHANGVGGNTGSAIYLDSTFSFAAFERMRISGWNGEVLDADMTNRTGSPFQIYFDQIDTRIVDGGDLEDALFTINLVGPGWDFKNMVFSPTDSNTGAPSQLFFLRGVNSLTISNINIGGTAGVIMDARSGVNLDVQGVHYEPNSAPSTTDQLFEFIGGGNRVISAVDTGGESDFDHFVTLRNAADATIRPAEGANLSPVLIETDLSGNIQYDGDSSDVDNQTGGALTHAVNCRDDGVYKKSTGTGYDGGTNDTKYGP